jgi:hypothetical protein
MATSADAKFWAKVIKQPDEGPDGGCWEWDGARNNRGYGKLTRNKKGYLAHRWGYMLQKGEIPAGLQVNHTCDNRICVRGDHLYTGTQSENVKDSVNRGRWIPKEYYTDDQKKWSAEKPSKSLSPKAVYRTFFVETATGGRWV